MVNNHRLESDEFFTLTLVNDSFESDIALGLQSANVTILDDDCKFTYYVWSYEIIFCSTVVAVGLDSIDYLVEEGQEVRVCAQLMSSRSSCIVSFPFSVVVHTENETGMIF